MSYLLYQNSKVLVEAGLVSSIDSIVCEKLAEVASIRMCQKGSVVFGEGEWPDDLCILQNGKVDISGQSLDGEKVVLDLIEPTRALCIASFMLNTPHIATARAAENSQLLVLPRSKVFLLAVENGEFCASLTALLAADHGNMLRHLRSLKTERATQRVCRYLIELCESRGKNPVVELPFDKKLIASYLGMTPSTLSRILDMLQRSGVSMRKNSITAFDKKSLLKVLEEILIGKRRISANLCT